MIPFRDNIRTDSTPAVTIVLILVNCLVFLYELSLGPDLTAFLFQYGVVPANLLGAAESGRSLLSLVLPFFTSMFLHGGFLHLIGNMWYLWIFGDNVEDRLGHLRFILFYLLAGLGAGIVHAALNYYVEIPSVGASGAIAGVLGAYLLLYPFARVLTLVPIFFFVQIIEIPAVIVLGVWFLLQFLSGTSTLGVDATSGGVAWWAHIGGFLIGMLLLAVLRPRRRSATMGI